MDQDKIISTLTELFREYFDQSVESIEAFPHTASGRRYFRMRSEGHSVIGAYGKNKQENIAFISFSKHFKEKGLNVPEILIEKDHLFYLQQDLGNETLMHRNLKLRKNKKEFPDGLKTLYKKTIDKLIRIQIEGGKGLDYSPAHPHDAFDRFSMHWDLNYFKYYFLNLSDIEYDEKKLQDDFSTLVEYLLSTETDYFLFRDFQSRNVMLLDEKPFFIDYQGGRKGALQYDLASLLYQSKADIPQSVRNELLEYYISSVQRHIEIDKNKFSEYFYGYLLIRLIQVLGAYGKRGLLEKMPYFIQSIPLGLKNLEWWLKNITLPIKTPYLISTLKKLTETEKFKPYDKNISKNKPLVVTIKSFSYREGYPEEESENGGGFVFDCRNILNPGRFDPYKTQTGRDKPVQDFLNTRTHFPEFIRHTCSLVDKAVENYLDRNFESLSVNFGCTGGQHRSVYAADTMAQHLSEKYGVKINLKHVVQERKNWINEPY